VNAFTPKVANFEERVRASFDRQPFMQTIGASLARVAPGEAEIVMAVTPRLGQQHGFVHAGVVSALADTACG
jgi:acyl-coenzyme A thioesterase PaaI-like protein